MKFNEFISASAAILALVSFALCIHGLESRDAQIAAVMGQYAHSAH